MEKIKVGFTTGVFDMFHIGHLNLLTEAKKNCDYLIVAVTTDKEVYRVKNKNPIIPFEERIKIVEAIKWVDKVVPEENVDKLISWKKYKFDVIFKGDDWKGTEKWNNYEQQFKKFGVDVIYFPYTKHISSTKLRNKLNVGT